MIDNKINVLIEIDNKENREKTKRIETRKQFTKQNLSIFSKLQFKTRNRKKISQIIKNEKVENDELLIDDDDILEEKTISKSISTESHKRINESKLIESNKKKTKLINKQKLMTSHENDVIKMIKIEFQSNSKIDLSTIFRCEFNTMYLAISSNQKKKSFIFEI